MPSELPIDERTGVLIAVAFWSVIWLIIMGALAWTGVIGPRSFAKAPERRGGFGVVELLVGLGLWVLGPVMALGMLLAWAGSWMPAEPGRTALWMMGDRAELGPLLLVVQGFVSQAGMLAAVCYVLAMAELKMDRGLVGFGLGFERPLRLVGWSLGAGLVIIALTMATSSVVMGLLILSGEQPPTIAHDMLKVMVETDTPMVKWPMVFMAVMLAPLIEEVIFRGLVQTVLVNLPWHGGFHWAPIAATSALFSVIHLASGVPWEGLISLFVLSLGLGYAYERTGRLWAPIMIHAMFNGIMVGIAHLQVYAESLQ